MIYRFKSNMYMFFLSNSSHFLPFLIISWYHFIIFYFAIISEMWFAHTAYIQSKYTQNLVVYYFGKSIYRRSRAFLD